jgi:CDP-glucose 4,6-dehydratase
MDIGSFFSGKKVFITGHTGFKGSWLTLWLNMLGADIKGYALKPEEEHSLYKLIRGDELCDSIIADIRDLKTLSKEILEYQPDYIFHLAAQPLVTESYRQPLCTFEVNAQGTANVLEAMRQLQKPCIAVMITTDKVYENREANYHYKEDDKLGGYDPYSASKACAEIVISSFRNSFFNPVEYSVHKKSVSVARAGNVIGGGDWAKDRIIPDTIKAFQENKPVLLRSPKSIRPWQHVLDPLYGYLLLAAKQTEDPETFSDAFNFGPDKIDNYTVEDIAKKAIEYWGSGTIAKTESKNEFHEAGLLHLDNTKARTKLGWTPFMNSWAAVKTTIDWYKTVHLQPGMSKEITGKQIIEYMKGI